MKEFLDLNNKFYKENDKYIYKPKVLMMIISLFCYAFLLYLLIGSNILNFKQEEIEFCLVFLIFSVLFYSFSIRLLLDSFLSITIDSNGCELSWLFYKKSIQWNEFKTIRYESYENYKHRLGGRHSSPFPYKGCVIFSICDFKKPLNKDPIFYLKKTFTWFYINFYDEKDIKSGYKYDAYQFVFDENEFKEFVNKINLRIENYTD